MTKSENICVVLGGGGARGLAHLGVLRVFDRQGLRIDGVVGTSAGALVGAAYCLHPDAEAIIGPSMRFFSETVEKSGTFKKALLRSENAESNMVANVFSAIRKGYLFSSLLRKPAIFPSSYLEEIVAELVPDKQFSDTVIPFAVPALDIRTGEDVLIREGSLRRAVLASCSLPGFFPTVEIDGRLLVDAGVIGPVPVTAAAGFNPTVTIAVDISSRLEPIDKITQGLEAIMRVEAIAGDRLNAIELRSADLLICPDVGDTYWSDFSGLDDLVAAGERAVDPCLGQVGDLARRAPRVLPLPYPKPAAEPSPEAGTSAGGSAATDSAEAPAAESAAEA